MRVLNLWQKNEVFTPGVIQPLLALASDDASHSRPRNSEPHRDHSTHSMERHRDRSRYHQDTSKRSSGEDPGNNQNLDLSTATTIIQQQQEQISALLQQQQQLQTQATSLLAPALSSVLVQQQGPPGVCVCVCECVCTCTCMCACKCNKRSKVNSVMPASSTLSILPHHTLIRSYTHMLIHPYTHTPIHSYTRRNAAVGGSVVSAATDSTAAPAASHPAEAGQWGGGRGGWRRGRGAGSDQQC